jgi:hypothetical protein
MNTKLILVEGIPGSGKTTTAQFIRNWCNQQGIVSRLYLEGDWNHPADFESVACLDQPQYAALLTRYPAHQAFLEQHVVVNGLDYFFSYRKLQHEYGQHLPDALFTELAGYEVYELALEKYKRLILKRWTNFVAQTSPTNEVYIFECCFFQNLLTMLIGRHNDDIPAAKAYVAHLAALIAPLQPALIYLHPGAVQATLERVAETRPQTWKDFLIAYFTGQGYGMAHGWPGFEGVIKFYELRQAIELELFEQLPWHKLLINNAHGDWPQHYQTICHFLAGGGGGN